MLCLVIQRDIISLYSWLAIKHMTLNLIQSTATCFYQLTLPDTDLYVGDTRALARVDHYKYLGLNFQTSHGPTILA